MKIVSEGLEEIVEAVDSGQGGIATCYRFCAAGSAGVGRSYRLSAGGSECFRQNISVGEPERQRPVDPPHLDLGVVVREVGVSWRSERIKSPPP